MVFNNSTTEMIPKFDEEVDLTTDKH